MNPINKDILKASAKRVMFDMTDQEYEMVLEEFNVLLKQMNVFKEISNIDDISPMAFPFEVGTSYLREDIASEPLSKEDALKNSNEVVDGQIALPKVVG